MPRKGRNLERLVAFIEKAAHDHPFASVASPHFLIDKVTGERREFDVVITFTHEHHTLVLGIECRDRKTKVGTNDVEAFHAKCNGVVHNSVIVSSSGFTSPAIRKAEHYGISCLTLSEAEGFDWCLAPGLWQVTRNILKVQIVFETAEEVMAPVTAYFPDGTPIEGEAAKRLGCAALNEIPVLDDRIGVHRHAVRFTEPEGYTIDAEGVHRPINLITVFLEYEFITKLLPFKFHHYQSEKGGETINTMATVEFDSNGHAGKIVLLEKPGEGITVYAGPGELVSQERPEGTA